MPQKPIRELLEAVLYSPTSASVFKGVLSYVLCFVLYFISPVQNLTKFPSTGINAILISVFISSGSTVGACLLSLSCGLLGVGIGALNFFILGKLASAPVAQGFVFFSMVYILGWIKASSPKFFICSLLGILMTWNGIYTPLLTPNREFSAEYLISHLVSYAWGALIIICVNLLVFPRSSESELRMTIVHSLDHIRTFFYLIEKTFSLEITKDETKVRDALAQSIRADFNILQAKLSQTFIGLSYSRWSVGDYVKMVDLTISMQQSLITAYSSMISVGMVEAGSVFEHFHPDGLSDIEVLRRFVYVGLTEVQKELAVGPATASFNQKEVDLLKEIDLERDNLCRWRTIFPILRPEAWTLSVHSLGRNSPQCDAAARLQDVEHCIAIEVSDTSTVGELAPSATSNGKENDTGRLSSTTAVPFTPLAYQVNSASQTAVPHSLQINRSIRRHWSHFQKFQYDRVGQSLASDKLYHPTEPLTVETLVGLDDLELRPAKTVDSECSLSTLHYRKGSQRRISALEPIVKSDDVLSIADTEHSVALSQDSATLVPGPHRVSVGLHHSLIRTYSHSFAIGMFLDELIKLREFITGPCSDGCPRRKKLHFHMFESMWQLLCDAASLRVPSLPNVEMSIREAFDTLEGRKHVPKRISWLERMLELERALRSPSSVCAFKGACALTVLVVLFFCDTTRDFALDYQINGAVLTVAVGLTSTLGQSWLAFMFQISGQSVGLVYAFCVLKTFQDLGGYKYNPYGLVCAMGLFAIPMCYVLYTNPRIFAMPRLALNSAGGLVYSQYLNQRSNYDSPALGMGKRLMALGVSMAIVSSFQLLILRNPAKRTLRKAMAQVMKANTAYTMILHSYVRSTIPIDPSHRAPPQAIERVAKDLMKREIQIQKDITALMPLIRFAGVEPSFTKPFNAAEYLKIVRANQLILDRNRDARIAIGTVPLPDIILKEFVEKLAPHRRAALARLKTSLYFCTSTLQSKFPLPQMLGATAEDEKFACEIFHDALVLSSRLAHSPEELAVVKSPELTRYWLYMLSATSVIYQLEEIQESA